MKPYSSYKDSGIAWIGQIPSHWDVSRVASLYTENTSKNTDNEFAFAMRFNYGTLVDKNETGDVSDLKDTYSAYTKVKKNDVVINGLNLNYDFNSLRVAISPKDGIITSAYIIMTPRPGTNSTYYNYLFKSMDSRKIFHGMGTGIRLTLSFAELKKQALIIPPVDEQEAIVRFITEKSEKIDRYIAEQERLLATLDELRQAEIARAVTRGLNPDAPLRDSGIDWIGSIPAHWELLRLKNCGSIYTGLSGKSGKDFEIDEDDNDFALFVPFTNIFNNSRIRKDKMAKVKVQPNEQQNEVLNGDLLFLMSSEDFNGIGKCSLYALEMNTPVYLNSFCKGFRVTNPKVTPAYLCYLMNTPACKTYIDNNSHGFIRINLRQDILTACPIILPPLDDQQAIVEYLDAKTAKIDSMKADIQRQIGLLKEYKQRIIADAVTGKIDVRE